MNTLETITVKLKRYPTYLLCGKVLKEDYEKYLETKDESLILYKFCQNAINKSTINYKKILQQRKRKSRAEHLAQRIAMGYKST